MSDMTTAEITMAGFKMMQARLDYPFGADDMVYDLPTDPVDLQHLAIFLANTAAQGLIVQQNSVTGMLPSGQSARPSRICSPTPRRKQQRAHQGRSQIGGIPLTTAAQIIDQLVPGDIHAAPLAHHVDVALPCNALRPFNQPACWAFGMKVDRIDAVDAAALRSAGRKHMYWNFVAALESNTRRSFRMYGAYGANGLRGGLRGGLPLDGATVRPHHGGSSPPVRRVLVCTYRRRDCVRMVAPDCQWTQ
jgi:hypothetical protein